MNLEGAKYLCAELGISQKDFYNSISNFKGASKRLELISKNNTTAIYKDFAHSPSKLKASINAVKKQFPERKLIACIELHTFSSLNKDFLPQYKGTMEEADEAIVYFNPHTLEHKNLPSITKEEIITAFDNKKLIIYNDSAQLRKDLLNKNWGNANLLMMSSGDYDGIDFADFAAIVKD